jgi:DNA-binding IclR family transcriptional regulator
MPKLFDAMMELMAASESLASSAAEPQPSRAHLLTEDQIKVLFALEEAAAASPEAPNRSLAAISAATGLDKIALRACVRALAQHGLAEYNRGGRLYRGYSITKLGRLHLDMLTSRAKP